MKKDKLQKSLKQSSILFVIWLFLSGIRKINEIYILMKHSVAELNIPHIVLYLSEICAYILIAVALCKIVSNIRKDIIFERKNLKLFRILTLSIACPAFIMLAGGMINDFTDSGIFWNGMDEGMGYWITAGLFMSIIQGIFRYGIQLKEEQELTI